jgi:hypothetical protein
LRLLCEQAGELDREAGFSGSARSDDRQYARVALVDEGHRLEELALAAEKARDRRRKVDAPRASQRRELAFTELKEPDRAVEVLEPVRAKIAQGISVEQ